MVSQKLHDNWKMKEAGTDNYISVTILGSMYSAFLENKLIEDPFYRDNENEALKFSEKDYEFVTEFSVGEDILKCPYAVLKFFGLDTIADIWLNGEHIGYVDNMHREWEYEVKFLLKKDGNRLRILFYSPSKYIQEEKKKAFWPMAYEAMDGASHIRKSHCMFGWDWGPRLPDMGIFRDIVLYGTHAERLDSVYIHQEHKEGKVTLTLDVDVSSFEYRHLLTVGKDDEILSGRGIHFLVRVKSPNGEVIYEKEQRTEMLFNAEEQRQGVVVSSKEQKQESVVGEEKTGFLETIVIENPQLWWPNGLGEQPLYAVEVELFKQNEKIDSFFKRIGLRTLTIRKEPDEYGESFALEVNGIAFFAMGADYIPEDSIINRITSERTRKLLEQAVAANYNAIRVWGGGFYPHDFFWDICDELGLVVWVDFTFACAIYMLTEEAFEENMTIEFIQNIKRIRNHVSLGLWCGNNELVGFFESNALGFNEDKAYAADYVKLFEYILPKMVEKYDPQTFYWPSSPSSGGAFKDTSSPDRGDVHYWDVWHGNKPFSEYRKFYFRYLSEFGFQAFPSIRTIETFTEPEDRNIFSYVMEKHQRNAAANGKIMNYMEQMYLYPTNFDTLIYASQLLQADAIRYGVEHFRRNRGRCMGTIVWQLNDCWPVASWSSIDYYGRWKALHYYEKRFFAPIMISCQEESALTQDANPNAEPYEMKKSIRLCVANESKSAIDGVVHWALRDRFGGVLESGSEDIIVPAFGCTWMEEISMQHAKEREQYISYEFEMNGEVISSGTVLFTVPKFFRFANPELTVRVEGDEIVVTADAFARSVEIRNKNDDLILSDNFFDINSGEKRVKIVSGVAEGLEVRSVYDIR
ncbi:MAG: glycoside hydrolase family 2 protein [Lachnospiraceae bacterium]|nr:glycoside hydrolase family 2 protein [Lachnospiraceae bacterium]